MPVLELLEPDGSLSPIAPTSLLAVTMYPGQKQEAKREELLVSVAVQLLLQLKADAKPKKGRKGKRREGEEEKPKMQVPMEWLSVLLRSPSADKIIEDAAAYAAYSWVAGELIMFMLSAAIHHPARDSYKGGMGFSYPFWRRGDIRRHLSLDITANSMDGLESL